MLRWKIITGNRVGMVHDVLRIFAEEKIDILSMEVVPEQIHVKIKRVDSAFHLEERLKEIAGVRDIQKVEVMPYEEREQQLRAVLDSISEGIIAVNKETRITTVNPAVEKIIHRPIEEIVNRPIKEFFGDNLPIIECLRKEESYDNQEMRIDTPEGRSHYLTSGRPIHDEHGNVIGAVAIMKDIEQVRKLVHKVTQPSMITFDDIIYRSIEMQKAVNLAQRAAVGRSTILIRGESGTGKELFARAIHMASGRRDKPFTPINCGALPDSLLESELFGYEEGAFTGAKKGGKQGLFELAHGGTLFLDEIAELPTHLQVKLLRVLQEGKVRRLGSSKEQPVDVRIIAATNKDLDKMVELKEFREDLFYRLNVIPINIPPLRDRKDDILLLTDHFLRLFSKQMGKNNLIIEDVARDKLLRYDWPGNVRELRNSLERAVHLVSDTRITWHHLFPKEPELNKVNSAIEVKVNKLTSLEEAVSSAEYTLLRKIIDEYDSSRKMGEILGVSHTTVLNKLKKYNLI